MEFQKSEERVAKNIEGLLVHMIAVNRGREVLYIF